MQDLLGYLAGVADGAKGVKVNELLVKNMRPGTAKQLQEKEEYLQCFLCDDTVDPKTKETLSTLAAGALAEAFPPKAGQQGDLQKQSAPIGHESTEESTDQLQKAFGISKTLCGLKRKLPDKESEMQTQYSPGDIESTKYSDAVKELNKRFKVSGFKWVLVADQKMNAGPLVPGKSIGTDIVLLAKDTDPDEWHNNARILIELKTPDALKSQTKKAKRQAQNELVAFSAMQLIRSVPEWWYPVPTILGDLNTAILYELGDVDEKHGAIRYSDSVEFTVAVAYAVNFVKQYLREPTFVAASGKDPSKRESGSGDQKSSPFATWKWIPEEFRKSAEI